MFVMQIYFEYLGQATVILLLFLLTDIPHYGVLSTLKIKKNIFFKWKHKVQKQWMLN